MKNNRESKLDKAIKEIEEIISREEND